MPGKGDDGCRARGVVVGSAVEDVLAEVAQVVVVSGEDEAAVVAFALDFGDDVVGRIILEELLLDISANGSGVAGEHRGQRP